MAALGNSMVVPQKIKNWIVISQFSSVQSLSHVQPFATPWIAACQASLSITNSWSLLKLMSVKSVMPPNCFILCRPLLLLPPVPPSIRVFSNESGLHMRWPKYWSFSFSISASSEHPGLISFRMDWLDLLAVQGTLKSLLQHHGSKASIFWHSAFFTVQLSYPCMTTGKTIALTRWTFVGNSVISLLGIYPKELESQISKRYLYTCVYSSTIHNSQEVEALYLWTDKWINGMWYVFTMEYDLSLKSKAILAYAPTQMSIKDIMLW